jgi:hypothetical protein
MAAHLANCSQHGTISMTSIHQLTVTIDHSILLDGGLAYGSDGSPRTKTWKLKKSSRATQSELQCLSFNELGKVGKSLYDHVIDLHWTGVMIGIVSCLFNTHGLEGLRVSSLATRMR